MKALIIMMMILPFSLSAKSRSTSNRPIYKQTIERKPASVSIQKIITIDYKRGCCSQHGGAIACEAGHIECRDGFISMCGCSE